jgi:hypothetical protein
MSDIEGKVARVSEERVGKRASFKNKRRNRGIDQRTQRIVNCLRWNQRPANGGK